MEEKVIVAFVNKGGKETSACFCVESSSASVLVASGRLETGKLFSSGSSSTKEFVEKTHMAFLED